MPDVYYQGPTGRTLTFKRSATPEGTATTAAFTETARLGLYKATDSAAAAGDTVTVLNGSVPYEDGILASVGGVLRVAKITSAPASLVAPVYGEIVPRTFNANVAMFLNEVASNAFTVVSTAGGGNNPEPQDLSGIASLSLTIVDSIGTVVQTVANAALDRTNDSEGVIGWTNNSAVTSSKRTLRGYLRNDSGNVVILKLNIVVDYAPAA